jgi:hypothetical protein
MIYSEEDYYICYSHRIIFTDALFFQLQDTPSKNSCWWRIKSTYPEKIRRASKLVLKKEVNPNNNTTCVRKQYPKKKNREIA